MPLERGGLPSGIVWPDTSANDLEQNNRGKQFPSYAADGLPDAGGLPAVQGADSDPASVYGLWVFRLYCNLIRVCVSIVASYGPRPVAQWDCQVSISSSTLKNVVSPLEKTMKSGIISVRCSEAALL